MDIFLDTLRLSTIRVRRGYRRGCHRVNRTVLSVGCPKSISNDRNLTYEGDLHLRSNRRVRLYTFSRCV